MNIRSIALLGAAAIAQDLMKTWKAGSGIIPKPAVLALDFGARKQSRAGTETAPATRSAATQNRTYCAGAGAGAGAGSAAGAGVSVAAGVVSAVLPMMQS